MKLQTDKETINILSVKHRVNSDTVENIINHSLKCIRECMQMEEMPNVLIHNWGRFRPVKYIMEYKFTQLLSKINNKQVVTDDEWLECQNLLKVYNRIIVEEKQKEFLNIESIREILNSKNYNEYTNSK